MSITDTDDRRFGEGTAASSEATDVGILLVVAGATLVLRRKGRVPMRGGRPATLTVSSEPNGYRPVAA
jgi:hypothetical protein